MHYPYPDDEHVVLTDHERRQFHLIEQALADEDPRRPHDNGTEPRVPRKLLLPTVVIVGACLEVLAVLSGNLLVLLISSVCLVAAVVAYRWRTRS